MNSSGVMLLVVFIVCGSPLLLYCLALLHEWCRERALLRRIQRESLNTPTPTPFAVPQFSIEVSTSRESESDGSLDAAIIV